MEVSADPTTDTTNAYNYMNTFFTNPVVYIILIVVLALYFVFFYSLGNKSNTNYSSSSDTKSSSLNIVKILVIILVVILLIVNGITYFLGINVSAYITGLFTGAPVINIDVDEPTTNTTNSTNTTMSSIVPEIPNVEEVFNIPGNYYGYEDAQALCDAYGATIASYDQVEQAYNKGGEWCNYGWSDGQMALYPTQQNTFQQLQNVKGHEHDCGRPGINGGYIANPNVKFGVNCFGHKPEITQEEQDLMNTYNSFPQTVQDQELQKKTDYWKNHIDEILVSPFNSTTWSRI